MPVSGPLVLFAGAVFIGLLHGAEPGHGWPIAATYALDRRRTWFNALLASVLIGFGHLVSSIAVVLAYFLAISYFDLTRLNDPLTVYGVQIGGPVSIVAGVMLILLGVREYRHDPGHEHGSGVGHEHSSGVDHEHAGDHGHEHADDHGHEHAGDHGHEHAGGHGHEHADDHGHEHAVDHGHEDDSTQTDHSDDDTAPSRDVSAGLRARIKARLPFAGGHAHEHNWDSDRKGLVGITWTAFVLGFAHEEEFEIIGLCTGSPTYCLPLMLVYALAVIVALVGLTLGLVAGYERYEERVGRYVPYFPIVSAVVLSAMGVGFVFGLF